MRPAAIGAILPALGVLALASPASAAATVTVRDLLADPPRFKGKTVQLRVVVDQCSPYACHVCDVSPRPAPCVGVGHWAVEGVDPQAGWVELGVEAGLRRFYRFTTVTLTAKFYLHTAKDEAKVERDIAAAEASIPGLIIDRFDSGPHVGDRWLDEVKVQKIERRWSPLDGVIMGKDEEKPLLTPSDEDYQEMIKTVRLYLGSPKGKANESEFGPKAYRAEGYEGGWVCEQTKGQRSDWPTRVGQLWPTPTALFDCVFVEKNRDGRWAVVPGDW